MSMTCPVIKCFKSREPAYRSSSILIPHFLSCFFFSFCLLSSSSSAFVFSGNGTEDIENTSDLFLEILRDEAVDRLYELGKVSDASGYLERTFMSPASMRAINLIQTWMEDAGLRTWVDEMGNVHGANADAEALLFGPHLVDLYLLPQPAFPTGGLYFKNKTWVKETKGEHVIIHNNYIIGFEKKTKRFRDYGLWLVDDHALESPLGRL